MKFFIDECLSPRFAHRLAKIGFDAVHPRDYGRLGEADHQVLRRCLDEDRIIVTHNAGDFRNLVGKTVLHPGLIILEIADAAASQMQMNAVIAHIIEAAGDQRAEDYMINRVIEATVGLKIRDYMLPPNE